VRNGMNDMLCSATLPSWTNFNVEVQLVGQERQCPWLSPVPENRASYPVCFPAGFHFGDSALIRLGTTPAWATGGEHIHPHSRWL